MEGMIDLMQKTCWLLLRRVGQEESQGEGVEKKRCQQRQCLGLQRIEILLM